MRRCLNFFIDGEWRAPAGDAPVIDVVDPATEETVGSVALGGEADAVAAIKAARGAFDRGVLSSPAERIDLLRSICAVYERRMEEMAEAITQEMGAPLRTLSRPAQAKMGLAHFKTALAAAQSFPFEKTQGTTRIRREPVGVCALITPWNWPVNQIACKVAPALATGCAMVLKPSEFAPWSAQVFAEILAEAGTPAGAFNMLFGDGPVVGPVLASHPDVDMVSLTGSTRAGVAVSRAAAPTVKRVSLELGGKSANIICPSADFAAAVTHGVKSMMSNTGQSCNAPSRMFVPADRAAEAAEIARTVCAGLKVGSPRDPATTVGPIANRRQYERVREAIATGIAEGADLVCGGLDRPAGVERGFFVQPTVFGGVTDEMTVAREEIFGPVLSILSYRTVDEAVARADASPYGLSGYVWAGTIAEAEAVAARLRTGMVHLNGASVDLAAPFGGYKTSGLGREWGVAGFEEFLETKAVMGAVEAV